MLTALSLPLTLYFSKYYQFPTLSSIPLYNLLPSLHYLSNKPKMADIVVPIVLENLIKLLTYEANLLGGVEDGVISLRQNLEFMNAFLKKSAGKRTDELVKVLVDQIRDVALDSEDVVDTYMERAI